MLKITAELLSSIPSTPYSRSTKNGYKRTLHPQKPIQNWMTVITLILLYCIGRVPGRSHLKLRNVNQGGANHHQRYNPKNEHMSPLTLKLVCMESTHQIRKYSYKCKMSGCEKRFSNTHDWNSHHRLCHASVFRCGKCSKVYPSPSSYRNHLYTHPDHQYKCRQCNQEFPFLSGVKNHRRVHLNQKLFKCFAGGCKSSLTDWGILLCSNMSYFYHKSLITFFY